MAWLQGSRKKGWRVVERISGQCVPQTPYVHDHADALQALASFQEKKKHNAVAAKSPSSSMPIGAILAKWKAAGIKDNVFSPEYGEDGEKLITRMATAMEWKTLRDVTKASVKLWREKTEKNTAHPLRILKSVLNWLKNEEDTPIDEGVLDVGNREVKAVKEHTAIHTMDEMRSAWQVAFNQGGFSVGMAIEHLMLFPCRPIDVCRCRVKDWDSGQQLIRYRKTKNRLSHEHWVPDAHAKRLDQLAKDRNPDDFLFLDQFGRPWCIKRGRADAMASWYYHNVGEKLFEGKQRGIYRLKHFAMTHYNKMAGGDRAAVMLVSGHLTMQMVDTYSGTHLEAQRAIIQRAELPFLQQNAQCGSKSGSKSGSNEVSAVIGSNRLEFTTPWYYSVVLSSDRQAQPG